jgi:hypothetical protein
MTQSTKNMTMNDDKSINDNNEVDPVVLEVPVAAVEADNDNKSSEEKTEAITLKAAERSDDANTLDSDSSNSNQEEEKMKIATTELMHEIMVYDSCVNVKSEDVHEMKNVDDEISTRYDNNTGTVARTSEELLQDAINDHLSYLLGNADGQDGTPTSTASKTNTSEFSSTSSPSNQEVVAGVVENSTINKTDEDNDINSNVDNSVESQGVTETGENKAINSVHSKVFRGVVLHKEQRKLRRHRLRSIIKQCTKLGDVVSFTRLLNVDLDDSTNYMNQYFDESYYYELEQYQQQERGQTDDQISSNSNDQNQHPTPIRKRGRPPSTSFVINSLPGNDKMTLTSPKPKSSSTTIHRYRISIDEVLGLPSSSSNTNENKNSTDNDNETVMTSNKRQKLNVEENQEVIGHSLSLARAKRQQRKLITPIVINEYFRHQPVVVSKNATKSKNQSQKVISSSSGDISSTPAPPLRISSRRSIGTGYREEVASSSLPSHLIDDDDTTPGIFYDGERSIHIIPEDDIYLSNRQLQIWIRQQLEYFSATNDDVELAQNSGRRRTPTVYGRVGIRCIHCKKYATDAIDTLLRSRQEQCNNHDLMPTSIPAKERLKYWPNGSITYPISVSALYANCSLKVQMHFLDHCPGLPQALRQQMLYLMKESTFSIKEPKDSSNTRVTAMNYFIISAKQLGLVDVKNGIRFGRDLSLQPISFDTVREQFEAEQQQKQHQMQLHPSPPTTMEPPSPRATQVISNPDINAIDSNIVTRGSTSRSTSIHEPRQQRRPSYNITDVSAENILSSTTPQLNSGNNDNEAAVGNYELDEGGIGHSPGHDGNVPINEVPAEIESVLAQAVAQEDDSTIIIGRASDKVHVSDYMYLLIKQMKYCHGVSFDYTTRGKKPKAIRIGYAGYNCRWCQQHADTVLNKYLARSDNKFNKYNSIDDDKRQRKEENTGSASQVTTDSSMDIDDELNAQSKCSLGDAEVSTSSSQSKIIVAFSDVSCRSFPSACENMSSSICNSFANHLQRCHYAPKQLKDAIAVYKKYHPYQIGQMVYGSQRKMIIDIWKRIRSLDRTEDEMKNITLVRVYESEVEFEDGTKASNKMAAASTTDLVPSSSEVNTEMEDDEMLSPIGRTPNFPHITDPLTLDVLKDSEEVWDTSENDYLIQPSDRYLVTDYVFLAFRQSKIAFPEVNDADDLNDELQVANDSTILPGIACMHCLDKEDDSNSKYTNRIWCSKIDSFAPCVNTSLYNHFMSCAMVPSNIKHALEKSRKVHSTQCCRIKFGSQRRFFEKIFARLKEASINNSIEQDRDVVANDRQERVFNTFRDKISKFGFIVAPGTPPSTANCTLFCTNCRSVPIALRAQYSILFGMNSVAKVEEHAHICKKDQVDLDTIASVLDRALWKHHDGNVSVLDYESYHALIHTACGGDSTNAAFKLFTNHIKKSIPNYQERLLSNDDSSKYNRYDLVDENETIYGRDVEIETQVTYRDVEEAFLCFVAECNDNVEDSDKHIPLQFSECPTWMEFLLLISPYLNIGEQASQS